MVGCRTETPFISFRIAKTLNTLTKQRLPSLVRSRRSFEVYTCIYLCDLMCVYIYTICIMILNEGERRMEGFEIKLQASGHMTECTLW